MAGRDDALLELDAHMADAARAAVPTGRSSREIGVPIARGLASFARGRYAESIDAIGPVRDTAHRFGGSHAQRDLLTLTLIEAAIRAGDSARARHYAAERRVHKPASAWGERLWKRAGAELST